VVLERFGLPAGERLKSRIDFDNLYKSGKVILSDDRRIKAVYLIEKETASGKVKIAAAVSGKAGNAVWRNRLKRLLRTSYRLNKENLYNLCLLKKIILKIIISPYHLSQKKNKTILLDDIMPGVINVLFKIERCL
jgi:ribonuclease P protein component